VDKATIKAVKVAKAVALPLAKTAVAVAAVAVVAAHAKNVPLQLSTVRK
jgi:hypothetical protein